jgi:hypothetical protein
MSNSLRRTAKRLLAVARAMIPPPTEPDPCPHCGAPDLAEPHGDQWVTLLDRTAAELRDLYDALGHGQFPLGGWKAKLMWCPRCEQLVPVGRYDRARWRLMFLAGCSAEEAGPELQRNYWDSHLVHDVWNYVANGIMPGPGDWLYDGEEAPAEPAPEPGPAGMFDDALVDGDGLPAEGEVGP